MCWLSEVATFILCECWRTTLAAWGRSSDGRAPALQEVIGSIPVVSTKTQGLCPWTPPKAEGLWKPINGVKGPTGPLQVWAEPSSSLGGVAQLGEHLLCKQGVVGSIPIVSTKLWSVPQRRKQFGARSIRVAVAFVQPEGGTDDDLCQGESGSGASLGALRLRSV
jgi:hypothetical protein